MAVPGAAGARDSPVELVTGSLPEYEAAARRYFGQEQGGAWLVQIGALGLEFARIVVRPEWVAVLDFQQRFPSAVEAAMEAASATYH